MITVYFLVAMGASGFYTTIAQFQKLGNCEAVRAEQFSDYPNVRCISQLVRPQT